MDNIEKIIRERHSVRSYLDKKIEKEKVDVLNSLIDELNKESGLNIQLILDDEEVFGKYKGFILHYGRLDNCKNYIALIGKKSDLLEELAGYYGEHIVLKAQELGLNTCWVAGTYNKKFVKAMINDDEKLVCVIAIGYGKTSGNVRKSKSIDDVNSSKEFPDWYKRGIEFALLAPTAINQQKFKFKYKGENEVEVKAGIGPMIETDIGIVKYHFELGSNRKIQWK